MVLQLNEADAEKFIQQVNFEKGKGLVPALVQDSSSGKVLMQAFMNRETLKLTLTKGRMHYWSRTKGRIWFKGEESGHYSILENAILDCDKDSILFKVQQIGPCCHTGKESCFHNPVVVEKEEAVDAKVTEKISEVVWDRIRNPQKQSYVSQLIAKGKEAILRKISEESTELILAAKEKKPDKIVSEATDLLFHMLILLASRKIKLNTIFEELRRRHQAKTAAP